MKVLQDLKSAVRKVALMGDGMVVLMVERKVVQWDQLLVAKKVEQRVDM